jgi:hypothetical protein
MPGVRRIVFDFEYILVRSQVPDCYDNFDEAIHVVGAAGLVDTRKTEIL